ncbi:MAG: hypothetical protein IJ506_02510 [Clostridia bacterium]|nr:hypothetical protein [Clostridia bacterium]
MGKSVKEKKNKVPKITEAEYEEYISSLKGEPPQRSASSTRIGNKK